MNDRDYRWPRQSLAVVCLDGSSFDYIRAAIAAGTAPYLRSLVICGHLRMVDAAMPTFTNPNNLSIVAGVSPARHGIGGNFFLDRANGQAVTMNEPSLLRAETIPGAHVLKRGVECVGSAKPDILCLSTSDYVQHTYAPGSNEANRFYQAIDRYLEELDETGACIVITADHGMSAKTDTGGRPRIVFLQSLLDGWFGIGTTTVILPITDPYVEQHGSLGAFASVYVNNEIESLKVIRRLRSLSGIELVLQRDAASRLLELPKDRIGDIVVCTYGSSSWELGRKNMICHSFEALCGHMEAWRNVRCPCCSTDRFVVSNVFSG